MPLVLLDKDENFCQDANPNLTIQTVPSFPGTVIGPRRTNQNPSLTWAGTWLLWALRERSHCFSWFSELKQHGIKAARWQLPQQMEAASLRYEKCVRVKHGVKQS